MKWEESQNQVKKVFFKVGKDQLRQLSRETELLDFTTKEFSGDLDKRAVLMKC